MRSIWQDDDDEVLEQALNKRDYDTVKRISTKAYCNPEWIKHLKFRNLAESYAIAEQMCKIYDGHYSYAWRMADMCYKYKNIVGP
jgi:hypothetical protein